MTGAGVAMALTGLPDLGLTSMTEMAGQAARIATACPLPIVADADTGFGNALHVQRTVREYERAGLAALHLEDQTFPKRCGHLLDKSVIDAAEFADKIRAAVEARTDSGLVIIARTDARGPLGFDEAIRRANVYAAAGADMIFVEAPQTVEEIAAIPAAVGAPVMFNVVAGGRSPKVADEQLAEWGYAMAIKPGLLLGAVVQTMIATLARHGAPTPMDGQLAGPAGLFGVVGLQDWLAVAERYGSPPV